MNAYLLSAAALLIMVIQTETAPRCQYVSGLVCDNQVYVSPSSLLGLYRGLFRKPPAGVKPECSVTPQFGRVCKYPYSHQQDPCLPNPCKFGGTCIRQQTKFKCVCVRHKTGKTCEQDHNGNPCASYPCQAGGKCEVICLGGDGLGPFIYKCTCPYGRVGISCEIDYFQVRGRSGGSQIPLLGGAYQYCDYDKCCETCGSQNDMTKIEGRFIVHLGEYRQLVDVGECCFWTRGQPCPYSGICDDYSLQRSILVYTPDFTGVQFLNFYLPAHCRCV